MTDQASLFFTERGQLVVAHPGEHRLRANFERFHADNPQVYAMLVRLSREWRRTHIGQCGIKRLFELARWDATWLRTYGEPLKLNNNYHAFYAREIMEREPDLRGLFKLREQRA